MGSFVLAQPGQPKDEQPRASHPRSKWEKIADVVRSRITNGEYPPRHLISEVKLEQEFGVARVTVRKVTAALREEGLIATVPGMGSFVAPEGPTTEGRNPEQE